MFYKILILLSALTQASWASVPPPVITSTYVADRYATVAGRLASKPPMPVGISVRNGNTLYSTLTDANGLWALVILISDANVYAASWSLTNSSDRSAEVGAKVQP